MTDKTTPLKARLRALLAEARFAPGAQRVLPGEPLAAVLREINETILGRALVFSNGAASIALDVAGRRLLRVTAAKGLEGAERCLGVAALEDAQREDVARLLCGLAKAGGEVKVSAAPLGRGGEGLSVGLPVARLADQLGVDLNAEDAPVVADTPVPEGFLHGFVAQMGEGLPAWLIRQASETLDRAGEEEMLAHLEEFVIDEFDALSAQLDRITATPEQPVCTVLGADLLAGHSIVCLRAEGAILLGVVAGDAAGAVLAAWNAARG